MTSNIGAHLIMDRIVHLRPEDKERLLPALREEILGLLKQTFRPEFLNRIDEIVLFEPLTQDLLRQIVELQLRQVQKRLEDQHILLSWEPEVVDFLAQEGYDVQFGARPLKRAIQQHLLNPLAEKLLSSEIPAGSKVTLREVEGVIFFRTAKPAEVST